MEIATQFLLLQNIMGCAQANSIAVPQPSNAPKKMRIRNSYRKQDLHSDTITEHFEIRSNKLTDEQLSFAVTCLQSHTLFCTLSKRELKTVAQEMVFARNQNAERFVFRQGDIGCCFFVIWSGEVSVQIDGKVVRSLGKGETFGELALILKCARTASILCGEEGCEFFVMKPAQYKRTVLKMKMEQHSKNVQAIQKVPLFACLTNKQIHALAGTIKVVVFNPGEYIFRVGEGAQAMYIISDGNVKIEIAGKNDIELVSGEYFGEASIKENMKRSGSAKAVGRTVCSMISRNDVESTLGSSISSLMFYNIKKWAVMRSPIFKNVSPYDINRIIIAFHLFFMRDGQKVEPQSYRGLIICLQGSINRQQEAKIFNEDNWISRNLVSDDGLVKNGDGYCCCLPFSELAQILEDIDGKKLAKDQNKKDAKDQKKKEKTQKVRFNLSDFIYLKKLGEGQFGQVFLVKNVQFGTNLFAIKCLSKDYIKKEEMEETVIQEKKILEKTIFPYIVGFVKAFHDKKFIYLVMQYIHGKEMFDVIREVKTMPLDMVKYNIACLLISIEYLHSNNIVYRDLKPENSVVDSNGKVHLIDMGTAKELTSDTFFKTFTIIGTPHYMAPEVFEGNGYSFEVDIWSLGCILYEFLCFSLPFAEAVQNDPYSIYTSIKKTNLSFPKFMKDEKAKKLITQLLSKSVKQRTELTFQRIKKDEFFKGFNWNGLLQEELKGPYVPKEFRNNQLEKLQAMDGVDFLRHLYNCDQKMEIQEWNNVV